MRPKLDPKWTEYFRQNGYPGARGLSTGMEGAVYSLVENKLVAKVWLSRSLSELQTLKKFYDALMDAAGRITTPYIQELKEIDGTPISIERYLTGSPLQIHLDENSEHANQAAVDAVIDVLDFLRTLPPCAEFGQLAVLNEQVSPWKEANSWSGALGQTIERCMRRYGHQLANVVPNLDRIEAAVRDFLKTRDGIPMSLVHGDLCGANIMVDETGQPLSVFDFGFLSTVGDAAFDASISSAIFNMYGPYAREVDNEITEAMVRALGYPKEVLMAYRAAYSLLTSNAYSPAGTDGHFRWCVAMLRREDVRASLDL
ncbi:MAG: phosphotransferase [Rhizobiales bacterium]|nr:phosphotransferase [Hyphomicrobiales bacterium]